MATSFTNRALTFIPALCVVYCIVTQIPVSSSAEIPTDFPPGIQITVRNYSNWANEIHQTDSFIVSPRNPEEVALIANWASASGYKVRPMGAAHGFSPLILPYDWTEGSNSSSHGTILINGKLYLKNMEMLGTSCEKLRVQTGAELGAVTKFLESHGCALFSSYPSTGTITVGGTIGVNAHGTGVHSVKEPPVTGRHWGTLSNSITSFEAVVSQDGQYVVQRFDRQDKEAAAFLTCLGRVMITSIDVLVVPLYTLRARSYVNIPMAELLTLDEEGVNRTITSFMEESGRIEIMWYPFTEHPWLKVWSFESERPLESREISQPYPYPFMDQVSQDLVDLVEQVVQYASPLTPMLGQAMLDYTADGIESSDTWDIWGNSSNILFYALASNIKFTSYGWEILTSRGNVQTVMKTLMDKFDDLMADYRSRDQYPMNGPNEIRVSGLDTTFESSDPSTNVYAPLLSTRGPLRACPHFDTVVMFTLCTHVKTPQDVVWSFLSELETYVFQTFPLAKEGCDGLGVARPAWSKGVAVNRDTGPWTDQTIFKKIFPQIFDEWEFVKETVRKYDSADIYTNDLLQTMMY